MGKRRTKTENESQIKNCKNNHTDRIGSHSVDGDQQNRKAKHQKHEVDDQQQALMPGVHPRAAKIHFTVLIQPQTLAERDRWRARQMRRVQLQRGGLGLAELDLIASRVLPMRVMMSALVL
jgi:hypothetical protein